MSCCQNDTTCESVTINNVVPFCCLASVPASFDVSTINLQAVRFIFNTENLRCCVDRCLSTCIVAGTPVTIDLCVVRVVGCIDYLLNAYPVVTGNKFGTTTNPNIPIIPENVANICCQDRICIDNVVGVYSPDAVNNFDVCETLNLNSVRPNVGVVGILENIEVQPIPDCEDRIYVKFTGRFELPTIVTPVVAMVKK